MRWQRVRAALLPQVPDAHRVVHAAGRQLIAVGAELHTRHLLRVALQRKNTANKHQPKKKHHDYENFNTYFYPIMSINISKASFS